MDCTNIEDCKSTAQFNWEGKPYCRICWRGKLDAYGRWMVRLFRESLIETERINNELRKKRRREAALEVKKHGIMKIYKNRQTP